MNQRPTVSLGALNHRAELFRRCFEGGPFGAWEICGCVRRGKGGDELVHVVRPNFGSGNLLWARLREMSIEGQASPWREVEQAREGRWIEEDAAVLECRHEAHPFKHTIALATYANWGVMLAKHTGPASFWKLLGSRLQHAGTLKIHEQHVCSIDRSTPQPTLHRIEVPDEAGFFAMARTRFKQPRHRYEVLDADHWRMGMLPEHYPDNVTAFASPEAQPHLFDNSKPAFSALDPRARAVRQAKRRR
ncbi:MAG TPA: hypothetical protein VG269_26650 [Tepidisphaeraceae bacterium]|nr:hypothetical protein [Tepidisphaeraceae bacterium]